MFEDYVKLPQMNALLICKRVLLKVLVLICKKVLLVLHIHIKQVNSPKM